MQVSYYPAPPPPGPPSAVPPGAIPQQQTPALALDGVLASTADIELPNFARAIDHLLGGSANFAVDRGVVAELVARQPLLEARVRATRAFTHRVVRWAADRGIDQFLDLGCGIPSARSIHELVRRVVPDGRVAYVDLDPVTVAHARAIVGSVPDVAVSWGDLRTPECVLAAPEVRAVIDPDRPVAVLVCGVLPFVHDDLGALLGRYRDLVAPGSVVAATHPVIPEDPESLGHFDGLFSRGLAGLAPRSAEEIRTAFAALQPGEPGVVGAVDWPVPAAGGRHPMPILAAVSAPRT